MPPVSDGMEKSYDPVPLEKKWRSFWLENEKFKSGATDAGNKPVFSIVMPPPNVTGSLHIGHALNNTLQDALARYKRMKGFDVLWVPGTDHAGIATQMVVERELAKQGVSKERLGKDGFIEKVWEFKEKSSGRILEQIRRLGFIPDWSAERFTMDEKFSDAVRKVFVDLYRQKFIHRDKRLVNYDPHLKTAVSNLEVEQREVSGHYWHIKYPVRESGEHLTVATTRPETMFGDVAVAVHPGDERYKHLVGKEVELPLTDRFIPVIADDYSDPDKGSGAVKITPAHDFNDFDVGKRHGLPFVNIFDEKACLNENVPADYIGYERFEAREKLIKELERGGFLEKKEDVIHTVPYGDRSGSVIEPRLMEQWYMDMKEFAKTAVASVESGKMKFFPKFWERTYFQWMKNIEPWCISRQLWWGHQIPAWYGPDGAVFVEKDEETAAANALKRYGKKVELTRDPNVLDTWFSSALWPFVTLNWPWKKGETLEKYYPTSVLITGFDIIFFWVARMAMMGLKFTGKAPFRDIYIHGLIRDDKGEKMSKTKGNVIDPLEVSDEFGADTLRFCLSALASGGRDIELSVSTIRGYRNFMNKIWNASRFVLEIAAETAKPGAEFPKSLSGSPEEIGRCDKWILSSMDLSLKEIDKNMEEYEFGKAAQEIYRFFWRDFCDRYIEAAKLSIYGGDNKTTNITSAILLHVLSVSMRVLHPFCPHLTEEINERIRLVSGKKTRSLLDADYPDCDENTRRAFNREYNEMKFVFEGVVDEIRAKRGSAGIKVSEKVNLFFLTEKGKSGKIVRDLIQSEIETVKKLAGVSSYGFYADEDEFSSLEGLPCSISVVSLDTSGEKTAERLNVNLKIEPVEKEKSRTGEEMRSMEKELEDISSKLEQCRRKLSDPDFINKAPGKIIEKEKGKLEEFSHRKVVIESELKRYNRQ